MICRIEAYLKAQGDGRARVICKHRILPSDETIKIIIQNIGQRDSVPSVETEERDWGLRNKLIKVILAVVWDVLALG